MKFTKIITLPSIPCAKYLQSPEICNIAAYCFFIRSALYIWLHNDLTAATYLSTKPAWLKHRSFILNTTKIQSHPFRFKQNKTKQTNKSFRWHSFVKNERTNKEKGNQIWQRFQVHSISGLRNSIPWEGRALFIFSPHKSNCK